MKNLFKLFLVTVTFALSIFYATAQENVFKNYSLTDGSTIKIYQPQPESFVGNSLKFRTPFSLQTTVDDEPLFGTFWAIATVQTNRDSRTVEITSVQIPNLKLPSDSDANHLQYLKTSLETSIPNSGFALSLDYINSSLETYTEEKKLSHQLNNQPPKIIYTNKPSILVLIDGAPKLQMNTDWGLQAIVNTPFTIVNYNNQYYLYGNKLWYVAPTATSKYQLVNNLPTALNKVQATINSNASTDDAGYTSSNNTNATNSNTPVDIVISTVPAELVQVNGDPQFNNIDGTSLSYASNSNNDLFVDNNTRDYYLLISGRWYQSNDLNQDWKYIEAKALPKDFSMIPEGSAKDNVLASVPGTDAAREAVIDAQIPQIAKVDRKTATANVTYDGNPSFQNIDGTTMQYAINSTSSILRYRGNYYCVENGVWFQSFSPTGPWQVCTQRPEEVDLIPPSNPMYQTKYVYIYDVSPQYIYMGYTSGYLNNYIYGGRVVYGTGFYYNPWRGAYYYPRACTWGFGMRYHPWFGWSINYDYGFGWLNIGFGRSNWNRGYYGGWWGPVAYHPPFCFRGRNSIGLYGRTAMNNRNNLYGRSGNTFNRNYTNNVYKFRKDVSITNNINRNKWANNNVSIKHQDNNKIFSDREGNVYKKENNGQWMQNNRKQWKPVTNTNPNVTQNLDQQQHRIQRGEEHSQNFQINRNQGGGRVNNNGNNRDSKGVKNNGSNRSGKH